MTEQIQTNMKIYMENMRKISEYLFAKFYNTDEFDPYYNHDSADLKKNECLDKAERLYQFFGSVEEIKKMMEFLNTVNPGMAKELTDGL